VRDDATIYAPDELKSAEEKLATAKDNITWEKYQAVLDQAPELNASVIAVKEAVVSKQTQAAAAAREWTDLSEQVPKIVEALQSRVDELSKARKLPPEVKKETLETAKTELEGMKTTCRGHCRIRCRPGQRRRGQGQNGEGQGRGIAEAARRAGAGLKPGRPFADRHTLRCAAFSQSSIRDGVARRSLSRSDPRCCRRTPQTGPPPTSRQMRSHPA
jgi:hypothetical protein